MRLARQAGDVVEIRCKSAAGDGCNRKLAVVDGPTLTILCPRCNRPHVVPILVLVQELTRYLAEVEAKAGQAGAGGFML
jgi:phage FluMu protein Com